MPKSGKKLVEGMVRVIKEDQGRWIVVQASRGSSKFYVQSELTEADAIDTADFFRRMLAAVVNAAMKEVGKCQK